MVTWQRQRLTGAVLLPLSLILYACGSLPNANSTAGNTVDGASAATITTEGGAEASPCDFTTAGRESDGKLCTMPPTEATAAGAAHEGHAMDLGPADGTYDLRFIDAMVIHHQGAVIMAEAALAQSQRPEVRQLAEAIIAAQAQEIGQMQQWRKDWYPAASAEPVMYHAAMKHDMAMSEEMAAAMRMDVDLGTADDEFDLRFLKAMIPHHEGALVMAKDLRAKSSRPEMQTLAEAILTSQQAEIDQMQQWQKAWYGQ